MLAQWMFEFRYVLRHPRVRMAVIAFLVSLATLFLVLLTYWLPARHATQSLTEELDHYRRIAHDKRYSVELAAAVKRVSVQVSEVDKKLDQSSVQATLVQHLSQLAQRHGLRIQSSNYDEGKTQDGFQPIHHELSLQGSYSGLRGFLADIPSLPTLTVIEDSTITRNREGGSLKAALQFRTWRRSATPEGPR